MGIVAVGESIFIGERFSADSSMILEVEVSVVGLGNFFSKCFFIESQYSHFCLCLRSSNKTTLSSFATQKTSHFATIIAAGSFFSTKGIYSYMECQNGKQH